MRDYPYSARIARGSGSNFYWSFFFLPRDKKNAILAVYAFSRLVDDAVDEATSEAKAREEIAQWRRRLKEVYAGETGGHPLLPELKDAIDRFHIPREYFEDLVTGMEMDLTKRRYETFDELETYCYHVASTIGLLCNHLFGYDEEAARRYAVLLGKAFQLTNIIRDVGKDAKLGRIYLPGEEMRRYGISEQELLNESAPSAFLELMKFEADRAEDYFQKASTELSEEKQRKIVPAEMMAAFYRRILDKIRRENFPVMRKKVSLSAAEKVALVAKTLVNSWR